MTGKTSTSKPSPITDPLEGPTPDFFRARRLTDGSIVVEGQTERTIGRQVRHPGEGARPDGLWVQWTWKEGRLTVTNDRHGYLPLYYVADASEICVSPSLLEVVRRTGRADWNPVALGVLIRLGTFLGDDTAYRDVRALPPNATLTWTPGKADLSASPHKVREESLPREIAMDGFIQLVREAVKRRLPEAGEQAWMPITGGRDSRHLLFELHRVGVRPRCLTIRYRPPGTTEDAEAASQLCAALGVEHRVVPASPDWLGLERRKNRLLGFTSAAHGWFLPIAQMMVEGGGVAYDGIGGDILSSGHTIFPEIMAHYEAGRFEAIARGWIDPENDRFLARYMARDVIRAMPFDAAIAKIVDELRQHADMPNPIGAYHMAARTRRAITHTQYGFLRRLNAVLSPYMDYEPYDFLSRLPWRLFADQKFHTDVIARAFPQYAHIPYARKGAITPHGLKREFRRRARILLRYLASRPSSRLVSLRYLTLLTGRAVFDGSYVGELSIFLLQLEREGGLRLD